MLFCCNNTIIPTRIFMVLSSYLKATARVHPVHVMNMARRQAAADPQTNQAKRLGL